MLLNFVPCACVCVQDWSQLFGIRAKSQVALNLGRECEWVGWKAESATES